MAEAIAKPITPFTDKDRPSKIVVRLNKELYKKLKEIAGFQETSLNQLCVTALDQLVASWDSESSFIHPVTKD